MKKTALFLALLLVFSLVPQAAFAAAPIPVEYEILTEEVKHTPGVDCYEVLDNTSFEILDTPETIWAWDITSHLGKANSKLGSPVADRSTDAHTGDYSLKLMAANSDEYAHALDDPQVRVGETYEFSIWAKKLEECESVQVSIVFSGKDKGVEQNYKRVHIGFNDVKVSDGWVKKTVRLVAPQFAEKVTFMLRLIGKGQVLYDDVSFLHITDQMPKPEGDVAKEAIKYLDMPNSGFEADIPGEVPNPENGWEGSFDARISDAYAHEGKNSAYLYTEPGKNDCLVSMNVSGFENGATYQLSAWVNNPEENSVDLSYWINYSALDKFSYDPTTRMGQSKKHFGVRKTEGWVQVVHEFTPPDNVKSALIMVRLRDKPGVLYADDISIYMVKAPDAVQGNTDETFYYTEWEQGYIEATPYVMEDPANSKAEFTFLTPDGKVVDKKTFDSLAGGVKYEFETALMEEMGQQYKINMKIIGPDGAVLQDKNFPVYRFDRPTYLGADGIFRKNGKEYTITLGCGGKIETIERKPQEGGVTAILLIGDNNVPVLERMDMAWEQGLLCMINIGGATSDPYSLAKIQETVTLVKDHPALLGYKVQDEPYQKGEPEEEMMLTYAAIRNADPHHPVYNDDSPQGCYPYLYRYSDMIDIDFYGASDANAGRIMTDVMDLAAEACKGRKPFFVMQQCFENNGYLASVDELRHIAYQSFFSGASGYDLYTLHAGDDGIIYMLRPDWQEIVNGWAKWERDFMYDCFVTRKYAFVNYSKNEDILWGTFTDGESIYAICLNRDKSTPNEAVLPLSDGMGTFKVEDYTARTMTGEAKRIIGTGDLRISLEPMEAVVWKVTPNKVMDFSYLKTSKYRDTIYYPWAYNAIATLEEKGIINEMSPNWYGPGEKITRGDYAMFLVRTLGINTAPGENFADVEADAEYAKELAIGKAAGIINGVGENKFNPEAQITRQDMMTMTSRAMKLSGATDLSAFSDNGSIADYAASHVSAMVAEGLIKGNADGTINPLGNTTRAEAAVIMLRILNK